METQNVSFSLRKSLHNLFSISFSCTSKKTTTDVAENIPTDIAGDSNPVAETPKTEVTIVIESEVVTEDTNSEPVVTETVVIEK